ncbi:MAG: TatD family hydrolase [Desulfurococcaceae archaeon]
MSKLLFSDAHLHVNPVKGFGTEKIAKKFKKEGGWFMAIVALPPYYYNLVEPSADSYRRVLEIVTRDSLRAKEAGLRVSVFMGLHPAEVDHYYRHNIKGERAFQLAEEVFRILEAAIKEGLIQGIGEVGRPHYSTSPEKFVLAEAIMMRALTIAKDHDIPVQLHLEQGGFATAYTVKFLVEKIGLRSEKIMLHHANLETSLWASRFNLASIAPVKQFDEKYASHRIPRCMLESDFLDDPQRPGVSAYPWEIPRTIKDHMAKGFMTEEEAFKIMVDNVTRYFGVEPP